MEFIPKRSSLVAQTAVILREGIDAGVWKDFLPGELELCGRFQVSRSTLRAALDQLRREGWLRVTQGKRREILQDAARRGRKGAASPSDRVVLLSPLPLQTLPANVIFWVDALRDHLGNEGYRLEFQASPVCYSQHPGQALEALARKIRPAGWVLYLSTAPQQRWFSDRDQRCVISGSRHPDVKLPSVDIDYAALCQHAVGVLAGKGCRRLALLMPRSGHAGNLESERGFLDAGEKLQGQGVQTLVVHHDGSVAAACRALDGLVLTPQPMTGLLVARSAHVVTGLTHLLRRGLRVPQDVSLISRDDEPILEHLVPRVARYHIDPALFARKISRIVVDMVGNGRRRQHDVRLMPALVRGETIG
jgi:DNA-binding LacI/PurR family transcriptional regulator